MTSKIIVNTIEADTGISSVTFASNINLQNDSSILVSSSGVRLGTGSTIAAPSANEITLSTNSAERLRITSAGRIGIGDNNPDRQVHITNTTDTAQVKLETTASSGRSQVQYKTPNGDWVQGIQGATTSGDFLTYTADSKNILWFTSGSERMRITSSGVTVTGSATVTEGLVLDGQNGSGKGLRLDLAGSGDYVIQETTTDDVVQFGGTGSSNFFVHNISSGNISIATTTGTGNLNVAGTGDCALDLIADIDNNGSNQWPIINFRRHSATGTPAARIYHHETNGALIFDNGGSERVRIQSGGGISFNGDSATANALDDYEEGTFTPTWLSGLSNPSYSDTTGTYTKIGNLVTFALRIQATGTNVGSHARIGSLPFTSSGSKDEGSASFGFVGNLPGNQEVDIYLHVPVSNNIIEFYYTSGAQFFGNGGNGLNGKTLHIRGFYYT